MVIQMVCNKQAEIENQILQSRKNEGKMIFSERKIDNFNFENSKNESYFLKELNGSIIQM